MFVKQFKTSFFLAPLTFIHSEERERESLHFQTAAQTKCHKRSLSVQVVAAWFWVSEHSRSAAHEMAASLQRTQEHTHAHVYTSSLPIVCLCFYDFLFVFYCSTAAQKDLESEHDVLFELNDTKNSKISNTGHFNIPVFMSFSWRSSSAEAVFSSLMKPVLLRSSVASRHPSTTRPHPCTPGNGCRCTSSGESLAPRQLFQPRVCT